MCTIACESSGTFFYVYYFLAAKINIIFNISKDMFDFNNYLTIYCYKEN